MKKYAVVTTFHQAGLDLYAQNFIDSFDRNMPADVDLYLYTENCAPKLTHLSSRKVNVVRIESELDALMRFKSRYGGDLRAKDIDYIHLYLKRLWFINIRYLLRKANNQLKRCLRNIKYLYNRKVRGYVKEAPLSTSEFPYLWDVIRFCHKPYVVIDAARRANADILIWMDADTVVHSKVSPTFLDGLLCGDVFTCYLGRKTMHSECGWYSLNLRHPHLDAFIAEFERMYEDAENGVFRLSEWHDSYIFDVVRLWHEDKYNVINRNLCGDDCDVNHPLLNSDLGQYFAHLKGAMKHHGLACHQRENGSL